MTEHVGPGESFRSPRTGALRSGGRGARAFASKSLARNAATPSKSVGAHQRLIGERRSTSSFRFAMSTRALRVRSVSIQPGRITFTVMPSAAQATAMDFVICTTPPFDAP